VQATAPDLHARMVDAVLAGDGLDAVATLAADAAGGAVAIVLPAVGAAVAGAGAERRLPAVRRFVAAQLAGQPGALPPGYVGEAPVRSGADQLGAVVLLDDGRPPAPTADGVLRLAAVAALTAAALRDAAGAGPRATGALLDELRRAPLDSEALVARALRLGTDLSAGAVALRAQAQPEHVLSATRVIEQTAPGSLVARRGQDVDALVPGEERAGALAARLDGHAVVGLAAHEALPGQLHRALREAELALALVRAGEATTEHAATGAWQLLIRVAVRDPAALRRLRDTSIGPVLAHDVDHRTDLLGTFRTYLAHGGNMNAAAAAIPSHRHTVAYRLDRLHALTGLDPGRPDDRERLGLGIKAQLVLDALDRGAA
jgi:PucR family transcriptional regulator, purine catabolism regulatory protein